MEPKSFLPIAIGYIAVLVLLSVITFLSYDSMQDRIMELESKLVAEKALNILLQKDHDELKLQFDTFKELTSKEFENSWKSFGAVRRNFIALGTSGCLENNDIAPEKYWYDDWNDDETYEGNGG